MPEQGWPTLADVHAAVLRVDGRLELLADRQEAAARELERHRADDRRELDELHEDVDRLSGRERWLAGGLAVLSLLVLGVGVPLTLVWIGG